MYLEASSFQVDLLALERISSSVLLAFMKRMRALLLLLHDLVQSVDRAHDDLVGLDKLQSRFLDILHAPLGLLLPQEPLFGH